MDRMPSTGAGRRCRRTAPALAAILVLPLLAACDDGATEPVPPPRPIDWTVVEPLQPTAVRTLVGVVQSSQRAPMSFEVAGQIDHIAVEIGDRFDAGATLATLDPQNFRLTLEERQGELAENEALLREAQSDFERQQSLFSQGWVSGAGFDAAEAALGTAESRVEMQRARVALAEEDLADTVIRAPYAGRVARRPAEPSQRVAAGETVLEIQGENGLEIVADVPETLVDRLEIGTTHRVSFPVRPDLDVRGTLSEIGTEATSRNAFPVTLVLDAPAGSVRPGTTAEIRFELPVGSAMAASPDLVAIPVTAFLAGEGDTTVAFVYDAATGTVARREIVIADVAGDRAVVADGLAPGDIVAARGLAFLRDGQAVLRLGVGVARYDPAPEPGR